MGLSSGVGALGALLTHLDNHTTANLVWRLGLILKDLGNRKQPCLDLDLIGFQRIACGVLCREKRVKGRIS